MWHKENLLIPKAMVRNQDTTIVNIYAQINIATTFMKQNYRRYKKTQIEPKDIFNAHSSIMFHSPKQKITKCQLE